MKSKCGLAEIKKKSRVKFEARSKTGRREMSEEWEVGDRRVVVDGRKQEVEQGQESLKAPGKLPGSANPDTETPQTGCFKRASPGCCPAGMKPRALQLEETTPARFLQPSSITSSPTPHGRPVVCRVPARGWSRQKHSDDSHKTAIEYTSCQRAVLLAGNKMRDPNGASMDIARTSKTVCPSWLML